MLPVNKGFIKRSERKDNWQEKGDKCYEQSSFLNSSIIIILDPLATWTWIWEYFQKKEVSKLFFPYVTIWIRLTFFSLKGYKPENSLSFNLALLFI